MRLNSVFDDLYMDNHRRQLSRRKREASKEPEGKGLTFAPHTNTRNADIKATPATRDRTFERLYKDHKKNEYKRELKAKEYEKSLGNPRLVTKSVPRQYDDSDDEDLDRSVFSRLYKKHSKDKKKFESIRKRVESENMRAKPEINRDYLTKLRNMYDSKFTLFLSYRY